MKLLNEFGITNVTVTGDTRFDRVLDVRKQARELPFIERFLESKEGKRPIVMVAGSSWPQDEAIFIPYFHEHPEMKLIIAPHEIHREHLLSIEAMLKRPSVRLSEAHEDDLADKDCLIIDSFGLLSSIYRYGQIAYIGGGFGAGIHNTLEAAVYGMPVLFGPRYHKFKEAKDLIAVGGGFSITDDSSFRTKMDELLTDPTALETSGCFILILFSEHRVPSGKASRCLFQDLFYLIRDVLLVDYQTEHILIKPLVCHDEVAGVRSGAPTILNHPFLRLSIRVEINSHQGHGV